MEARSISLMSMTLASDQQAVIIRTERGLMIAGTRITLYDVMDYVTAQYPPQFIRGMLNLTDEQVNMVIQIGSIYGNAK